MYVSVSLYIYIVCVYVCIRTKNENRKRMCEWIVMNERRMMVVMGGDKDAYKSFFEEVKPNMDYVFSLLFFSKISRSTIM